MENNIPNSNNNNNILLEIVKELNQIKEDIDNNLTIQKLGNIIDKINYIINENKINFDLIEKDKPSLNNKNNQEIKYDNGRYVGQVVNGLKEGKGIFYFNNGSRYEGEYKNDKREGKGIKYHKNGDRYEGEYKNDKPEGKGIK